MHLFAMVVKERSVAFLKEYQQQFLFDEGEDLTHEAASAAAGAAPMDAQDDAAGNMDDDDDL
jgi:hypothetical protein